MSAPRIVIVCGEASGDRLGAGLVEQLKIKYPNLQVCGVGGPLLRAQGMECWHDAHVLSHMGIVDPILNIRTLWRTFKDIFKKSRALKPDVFIGIDSPDFTLRLERKLKAIGIKTIHYVGPSVWAWRQNRIYGIKKSVDHMMVLFPFETPLYEAHDIPVTCVGMTLADSIPLKLTAQEVSKARSALRLPSTVKLIAVMCGSRKGEWTLLIPTIIKVMTLVHQKAPATEFVAPCINENAKAAWDDALATHSALKVHTRLGQAQNVLMASDAVLAKSGTTTLETMLYKKPMVVIYKLKALNYWLAKRLVKTKFMALPNLLADKPLVPEYLQDDIDPTVIAGHLLEFIASEDKPWLSDFDAIHRMLAKDANTQAANVVARYL